MLQTTGFIGGFNSSGVAIRDLLKGKISFEHILPSLHNEQNHLAGFLADFIINTNQEAIQLYEELQAVANLPLHAASHTQADYHAASMAWQAMMQQQQQMEQQQAQEQAAMMQQQEQAVMPDMQQAQEQQPF